MAREVDPNACERAPDAMRTALERRRDWLQGFERTGSAPPRILIRGPGRRTRQVVAVRLCLRDPGLSRRGRADRQAHDRG